MTTSQNSSGAPDPSDPPQPSGRHADRDSASRPHATPHPATQYDPARHGDARYGATPQGYGQAQYRYGTAPQGPAPQYGAPQGYGPAGPGHPAPGYGPAGPHTGHDPRYGAPGPYPAGPQPIYDGHPGIPFGGAPFGTRSPASPPAGLPAVPADAGAAPWPTAAQRATGAAAAPAVPAQRGATGLQPVAMPRNGFGTTALVLGIIGVLTAMIPIVGVVAWPMVILGLIFGVLGIVRAGKGIATNRGVAISGTVLSALGLLLCILWVAAFGSAVDSASSGAVPSAASVPAASEPVASAPAVTAPSIEQPAAAASPAGGDVITYEVTGSGSAGNITYVKDSNMGMEQVNATDLPWTKEVTFDGGVLSFQPLSLVAQSDSGGSGEITCRIMRNGQEITSSTSSGPYAVVSCSGS
ncbi:hypothetical protein Ae168Ps1_3818 [Pseudonocardia sp. Ae168_Ps1]|uniref:MmpS family transport accessory protein n=1 Tax=unclassified Pseudonocardia TaxID=2619320 RepID=UPI00094B1F59|nr:MULTISPECIES: MmpS family transport accessory protein [unclassified Pseudonocardia]OLL75417.1 hypothetical protein Ae150APs1_3795 [Pseudonocardia sp. Ae150A_Ps1]OLL81412.1 hypothetical protein Ae168Ps1_3818 [Pseudonocardia sp. Ae168_Ps1]OLL84473.1 hypothetical protein Ae263Ps1_1528c [Pseudonocardia sp. Ae263_Ps1]OLL95507.1 hypothetical protein Ae356Ps1_5404 [Pseudonocardia sp. Ae356_Ps1]